MRTKMLEISKVKCLICEKELKLINGSGHLRIHNITTENYKKMFPDSKLVSDGYRQFKSLTNSGPRNPNFGKTASPNISKSKMKKSHERTKPFVTIVESMIIEGFAVFYICKVTGLSRFIIRNIISDNFPNLLVKYRENNRMLGRTLDDIFGLETATKKREITSQWMKTDKNIRKFQKYPSKPQTRLLNFIKDMFPSAVSEYCVSEGSWPIYLDVALPEEKIDFEYDEPYWHKNKTKDKNRDLYLQRHGWVIIRINGKEELDEFASSLI